MKKERIQVDKETIGKIGGKFSQTKFFYRLLYNIYQYTKKFL